MKKLLLFALIPAFLFGCEALEDSDNQQNAENNQRITPDAQETQVPAENPYADLPTLRDVIGNNDDVSIFLDSLSALNAENLLDAENQQVTLFVPTNDAFDQIPEQIRTDLFKEENKRALDTLIAYHIATGRGYTDDFTDGAIIRSLLSDNGILINIEEDGGFLINKGARIVGDALEASNGMVYMIDSVLIPQNFLQAPENADAPAEENTEATVPAEAEETNTEATAPTEAETDMNGDMETNMEEPMDDPAAEAAEPNEENTPEATAPTTDETMTENNTENTETPAEEMTTEEAETN